MRRRQALFAVAAVAAGLLVGAWPAFADEVPAPTPSGSGYPEPPHKPIPSGSAGPTTPTTPPTGEPLSPPPFPPFFSCDPADPDCVPLDDLD